MTQLTTLTTLTTTEAMKTVKRKFEKEPNEKEAINEGRNIQIFSATISDKI